MVIVIADKIALYPPEVYERGLHCVISSITRNHPNSTSPRVKSLNYLNNVMAKLEARLAGADEAVMLNPDGLVSEATGLKVEFGLPRLSFLLSEHYPDDADLQARIARMEIRNRKNAHVWVEFLPAQRRAVKAARTLEERAVMRSLLVGTPCTPLRV